MSSLLGLAGRRPGRLWPSDDDDKDNDVQDSDDEDNDVEDNEV